MEKSETVNNKNRIVLPKCLKRPGHHNNVNWCTP